MSIKHPINWQQAVEIIKYDSESGKCYWRERTKKYINKDCSRNSWNTRYANKEITTTDGKGYLKANIFGRQYPLHRLVWLICNKEYPEIIDHINGIRSDNRIVNLRSVTHQQNHLNNSRASNNTSGVTGVYFNKNKNLWCAQMKYNGKTYHLGSSKIKNIAVKMRKDEERKLGFSTRHGELNVT